MTTSPTLSQSTPTQPNSAHHSAANSNHSSSGSPSPNIYNKKDKRPHLSSRQQYPPPPPAPYPVPLYYPPYPVYPPYMYPPPSYLQPPQQPPQQANSQRDEDQDDVEIIMNDLEAPPTKFLDRSVSEDITRSPPAGVHPGLRNQLQYYFSRQNLANDAYLVSQMDSDLYVPIATVASFNKVKSWTTDYDTVVRALKSIPAVTVDETNTKVKPNISTQRTTIILRDIDPSATKEDITSIFTSESNQVNVKDIKQEVSNMWYVTFDNEEETINMLFLLRGKTFKGKPIAGRIKSEAVLRNVQSEKPSPRSAVTPPLNPPSPTSTAPSVHNNMQMPFPPYPAYYGPQGFPILPMMPAMGWNPSQPHHPLQPNYSQSSNHQDGHFRSNNNNNNNNRKRFNATSAPPTGSNYPLQQDQPAQEKSTTSQPNFRNHTRKSNNRNQHGNNYKNNNRNQQTSRYGDHSIDDSANPGTQPNTFNHRPSSNFTASSDQSGEPRHTTRGSTPKTQKPRRKSNLDKRNQDKDASLQPGHFPPLPKSTSVSPDESHAIPPPSAASFSYADMLKIQQS